MTRTILVEGEKTFRITVPDDARLTFGPWSPPSKNDMYRNNEERRGTLRVYKGTKSTENILGVFSGVKSFRDVDNIDYLEKVATQEVSTMWKSDEHGYMEERKSSGGTKWIKPEDAPKEIGTSEVDSDTEDSVAF